MKKRMLIGTMVLAIFVALAAKSEGLKRLFFNNQKPEVDIHALLEKIRNANKPGLESIQQDGEIILLDANGEVDKVLERASFIWRYNQYRSFYSIDSIVQVRDGRVFLQVDKDNRLMAFSTSDEPLDIGYDVDTYLEKLKALNATVRVENENGLTVISVDSLQHETYQGLSVFVDPKTYEVRKLLLGMSKLSSLDDQPNVIDEGEASGYPVYVYFLEIRFGQRRRIEESEIGSLASYATFSSDSTKITAHPSYADFDIAGGVK